ncbi:LCP family glycopolymer transferase [Enterococcus villorum]|uniref:LytR family transcriptional regulator n=2 Tax=Enterococcus villorum TaxID=112904 RepID=A0A511J200_9ENTE|nr:LCP family protein [Enterococcus villorum]EOH89549.1 transcriptional regulator [Enterococcus villorum ATCC 700913]EOW76027.1 transcriptional regulator [Enterococcus villorum ATCC 700913]GEL91693.1 LytR family transcriptional regulator [Enterococcus villorum]
MKRWQKVVIALLGILVILIGGISAYGIKLMGEANRTVNQISKESNRVSSKRSGKVSIDDKEPFSVLLLGLDTGGLGRTEQGRSDTMMVVTVNPQQKKSTIISLDRDIYTNIVGYGTVDKLNHAYAFGGVEMAMDSIEQLLDIPIDHYVTINLDGMEDLIDAVGGIEVNNKIDFTLDGVHVPVGKQVLDGETGLAYSRMRHEDPLGDIGRQARQREVVTKIVNKVLSLDGVSNYRKILKAVEKNVTTDLDWDDMLDVATNYTSAFETIKQDQLKGKDATIDSIYYQILGKNDLLGIQNELKKQLGIKTSKTLPNLNNANASVMFYDDSDSNENSSETVTDSNDSTYSNYSQETNQYDYSTPETTQNYDQGYDPNYNQNNDQTYQQETYNQEYNYGNGY